MKKIQIAFFIGFIGLTMASAQTWPYVGTSDGVPTGYSNSISMAFSPSGIPYLAFSDSLYSDKVTVVSFTGTNWSVVGTAGFSAGKVQYVSMAFSPSGVPYIAYSDSANDYKATVMSFSGSNWSVVGTAGFSAGEADYTKLVFSPSGTPFVAYSDAENGYKAVVMSFDGANWGNVGAVGFSAGIVDYISFAFSPSGAPYIAYEDAGNTYYATVMSFSGSNWGNVGTAGFSAGPVQYTSFAFNPSGVPYIAYRDYINLRRATVMSFSGSNWGNVGSPGFSNGQANYISLAFSPSGMPFVAYSDSGAARKTSVMYFGNGEWSITGPAGFSKTESKYIEMAFSPSGVPYVAYEDIAGNATVHYYVKGDQSVIGFPSADAQAAESAVSLAGVLATSGLPLIFSSSDTSIVSIDGNIMKPKILGTVTITVNQIGNDIYNPVSAIQEFTVNTKANQTITGFSAFESQNVGYTITITGVSATSGLPVSFSSSDPSVASVTDSVITVKKTGKVYITASQAGDAATFNAAIPVTRILTIGTITGINEGISGSDDISIYPNPSEGNFIIELGAKKAGFIISSLEGRLVLSGTLNEGINKIEAVLPKGIYIISVGGITKKLIIQ